MWALPDVELRDPYDRYLMYLWLVQDGKTRFVNPTLVRGGFARSVLPEPNDRYFDLMQPKPKHGPPGRGRCGECAFFGQPFEHAASGAGFVLGEEPVRLVHLLILGSRTRSLSMISWIRS